jgi:hypothetical protein
MKKKQKIEEKYFEDIFDPIKKLWKGTYYLPNVKNTKTYVESIGEDYNEVEYVVDFKDKKKYTWWESMLFFTMYGTLTDWGLKYLKEGKENLNIEDIPIEEFEKDYLENLKFEGNEEYLAKYKGLKSRLN